MPITALNRYPGLDTLRACAILMVIPCHAAQVLGGKFWGSPLKEIFYHGWAGVDLFFVLSGFLIGGQLFSAVQRDGKVRFGNFYLKRSLRILPSYYFVLLVYALWPDFREAPEIDPAWRFMLFIMNYGRHGEAFSHAWSLCVEEHFYLIFPSLLAASIAWPRIFRPLPLIALIMVGGPLLRYYLWSVHAPFFPAVYRPSHTHLDGLTVGVLLALLKSKRPEAWQRLTAKPWLMLIAGTVLVAAAMWMHKNLDEGFAYALCFTAAGLGFGAWVVAAMAPEFWLSRARIPGAAMIATLAYTLYLTHKQMFHLASVLIGNPMENRIAVVALSAVLIPAASLIVHRLAEKPGLRLREYILGILEPQRPLREPATD